MSLLMAGEVLDLKDVFLVFLDGIGISTHCRKVVATTIFPATLAPKTSLVLVFLARLALVNRKLLVLIIRCVSGESVSRLYLFRVLLLLLYRLFPPRTP